MEKRWSKEVASGNAPQHLTRRSRRQTGGEERRGRTIDCTCATASDLVQATQLQATAWKARIKLRDAKWKDALGRARRCIELGDLDAQSLEGTVGGVCQHGLRNGGGLLMFRICSALAG